MKALLFLIALLPTVAVADRFVLLWDAPTAMEDGSELKLAGYKLYQGKAPRVYDPKLTKYVSATTPKYAVTITTPGTYYYTVTAYSPGGLESQQSNELAIIVTKPVAPANFKVQP